MRRAAGAATLRSHAVQNGKVDPCFSLAIDNVLAGAEGRPVGVLHSTLRGAPQAPGPAAVKSSIGELAACGYAPAAAAGALAACGGDADAALARLFWQLTGQGARSGEWLSAERPSSGV